MIEVDTKLLLLALSAVAALGFLLNTVVKKVLAARNGKSGSIECASRSDIKHLEDKMDDHHSQQCARFASGEKKFEALFSEMARQNQGQHQLSERVTVLETEHSMNHPK